MTRMEASEFACRVCGRMTNEPPWGEDGKSPTFEICECCGVEFGYEDSSLQGILNYREQWLRNGAKWFAARRKPDNWDVDAQLNQIPRKYRDDCSTK